MYRLTVKDVPVDGFWSISVYNAEGYFEKNAQNAYTLNNITAKKNDGRLGHRSSSAAATARSPTACRSCRAGTTSVRLYRPRKEILDGTWKFPEAQPVK